MKTSVYKKVTVIIPTYSGSSCIERAINSVLNQTYPELEIIVVDDNPPESIERAKTNLIMSTIMENHGQIKYICHEQNKNGAAARNTGIAAARGDYIAFLDDDDYYLPERVQKSVNILEMHQEADIVLTGVIITQSDMILSVTKPILQTDLCKQLLFHVNLVGTGSNMFMRKQAVVDIKGFDEAFTRLQDVEFLVRFFEKHKAVSIDEILVVKARGGANNLPQYKKLRDVKIQFWKKFYYHINRFDKEEYNAYYSAEYGRLLQCCIGIEDLSITNQAIAELRPYRKLTGKERIMLLLARIGVPKKNSYTIIRYIMAKILKEKRSRKLIKQYNLHYDGSCFGTEKS